MPVADLFKYLAGGARVATLDVQQALADCLMHVRASRQIEEPLIRLRILKDRFRFASDSQHKWPPAFLQLLHPKNGS